MAAGSHYSDQQRREAVACYVLHGTWRKVSELTGIPQRTLNDWSIQPWFGTLLAEVRAEKSDELDAALTSIIHAGTTELLDRLKNGDPVLVAGEIKRKPVSAKDLALVSAIAYDKRALIREQPERPRTPPIPLTELAQFLEASVKAKG
jgi:transposase-like protein